MIGYARLEPGEVLLACLFLVLFGWLQCLVHELGHGIGGWLAGMRPLAVGVGGFRLERQHARWKLRRDAALAGLSGFIVMLPREGQTLSRGRLALFICAGPVANLLCCLPALALIARTSTPTVLKSASAAWLISGLLIGVGNLLPFRTKGWLSDGRRLIDLWRDPDALQAGLRATAIQQLSISGTRPRDWPDSSLPAWCGIVKESAAAKNALAGLCLVRALDQSDSGAADACAVELHARWCEATAAQSTAISLLLAMYGVQRGASAEMIEAWRRNIGVFISDLSAYRHWLDAELAFRAGDFDSVRSLAQAALEKLDQLHDLGGRILLEDWIRQLQERARRATADGTGNLPSSALTG